MIENAFLEEGEEEAIITIAKKQSFETNSIAARTSTLIIRSTKIIQPPGVRHPPSTLESTSNPEAASTSNPTSPPLACTAWRERTAGWSKLNVPGYSTKLDLMRELEASSGVILSDSEIESILHGSRKEKDTSSIFSRFKKNLRDKSMLFTCSLCRRIESALIAKSLNQRRLDHEDDGSHNRRIQALFTNGFVSRRRRNLQTR
jgi:hypothetical protein